MPDTSSGGHRIMSTCKLCVGECLGTSLRTLVASEGVPEFGNRLLILVRREPLKSLGDKAHLVIVFSESKY